MTPSQFSSGAAGESAGVASSMTSYAGEAPIRILVVEADAREYRRTRALLAAIGNGIGQIDWHAQAEDARAALCGITYDVCLLEPHLGDRDGLGRRRPLYARRDNTQPAATAAR